jgi:hypothetical protein
MVMALFVGHRILQSPKRVLQLALRFVGVAFPASCDRPGGLLYATFGLLCRAFDAVFTYCRILTVCSSKVMTAAMICSRQVVAALVDQSLLRISLRVRDRAVGRRRSTSRTVPSADGDNCEQNGDPDGGRLSACGLRRQIRRTWLVPRCKTAHNRLSR